MAHALLAARIFSTPLLIAPGKLDAILSVVGPRLGMDLPRIDGGVIFGEQKTREPAEIEARVACVQAVGTLANRVDWLDAMSGMTSYEMLAVELDRMVADPEVDAILLEVDSFGGEAAGCFDVADRIHAARQQKPVFGVANQYAMSAGYALLSQCDRVFVPQSGEVGSIGVVTTHMDLTRAAEDAGVRVTHIHAGAHKVDTSPFKALGDDVRDRLLADVEQVYDQFLNVVARGGRATKDQAKETEALTYVGERAVQAGLADEVGTKAVALEALRAEVKERKRMKELEAKVAKLEADNARLVAEHAKVTAEMTAKRAEEDASYLESLAQQSADAQAPIAPEKLAAVKGHLAAGRRDVAHELGSAYLDAARAKSQAPFSTAPAAPRGAKNKHEALVERGKLRNERHDLRRRASVGEINRDEAKRRIAEINAELGEKE